MIDINELVNKKPEDLQKMLLVQAIKLERAATAYVTSHTSEAKAAVTVEKIQYMDITMAMLRTKDNRGGTNPEQFVAAMTAADKIIDSAAKQVTNTAARSQKTLAQASQFDAVLTSAPTSAGITQATSSPQQSATPIASKKRDTLAPLVQNKQAITVDRARAAIQESASCGNPAKVSEHSALMAATLATGYYNNMHDVDRLKPGMVIAAPTNEQVRAMVDLACENGIAPQGKFTYASIKDLPLQEPVKWPLIAAIKHYRDATRIAHNSRS